MSTFPEKLAAARLKLVNDRPYLAAALWAVQPVKVENLDTLAVDKWWRLYWGVPALEKWTVEELAGVLYHEINHLLRDHANRAEAMAANPMIWNVAADAEINDDIKEENYPIPEDGVFPEKLGLEKNKLAEEYYNMLMAQKYAPEQGNSGNGGGAGISQSDNGGDAASSKAGDADEPKSGGAGNNSQAPSDRSSASSAHGGASSQSPTSPVDGRAGGAKDTSSGAQAHTPAPCAGACGSCATGQPAPWELPEPGQSGVPGISKAEAELIRRKVAEDIRAHAAKDRGNVPGHWRRWAEEKLNPKIDWRRELAALVRRAMADTSGAVDYTYRRPSRRQSVIGNVVLPSLRRPVPDVAVVVDTSGSMGDREVAHALAEIKGILEALGQKEKITVISCDAQVQEVGKVFRPEQVKRLLVGGGGTDMGVGLQYIENMRPRPQVAIVVTDGYTPWPSHPPAGVKVVVALVGDGNAPEWARVVQVEE